MKKVFVLLLAVCLLLVGCREGAQPEKTEPSETQDAGYDILEPYFTGTVTEKFDGGCLVKVTDIGNGNFAVGQDVEVHTDVPGCPDYQVGDSLTISFDGKVTCSLPPQVVCVSVIHVNE